MSLIALAMRHLTAGEPAADLQILAALYHQMVQTGEHKSRLWVLPTVQAIMNHWQRSG
jgi:hypothetical protein